MERAHVERAYRAQYLFAAVFATGVMIPIGYEYGYRKRLRVVETRPADREQPHFDLTQFIAAVHEMKAGVPALNEEGRRSSSRSPTRTDSRVCFAAPTTAGHGRSRRSTRSAPTA